MSTYIGRVGSSCWLPSRSATVTAVSRVSRYAATTRVADGDPGVGGDALDEVVRHAGGVRVGAHDHDHPARVIG
jgi:hypothetical protein